MCATPTAADSRINSPQTRLSSLKRVQELQGDGSPFARLAALLSKRNFLAAAVDAPFSVPADFLSSGGHRELLEGVAGLSVLKSFPAAKTFADSIIASRPMAVRKPLRKTERAWQQNGVNVRSTLWAGPRGGAAMTAACLTCSSRQGARFGRGLPRCPVSSRRRFRRLNSSIGSCRFSDTTIRMNLELLTGKRLLPSWRAVGWM
jgi:hypothetical protein